MDDLAIRIVYYRNNLIKAEELSISPQEYFDDGEYPFDIDDSSPRYNRIIDYISDNSNIVKAVLHIETKTNKRKSIIESYYWAEQSSEITVIKDYKNEVLIYKEVIYQVRLPKEVSDKGDIYDLSRFVIHEDNIECVLHTAFIENGETGDEEFPIYP